MMTYGMMKWYLFGYTCLTMDVRDTCTLDGQRVGLPSREIDNFWKRRAGWERNGSTSSTVRCQLMYLWFSAFRVNIL